MVMHARKLPRMNDGFNDKHPTHNYENAKYSNKYRYNNHEKSRDSPSANSLRSSSPDSRTQSPRYQKVLERNGCVPDLLTSDTNLPTLAGPYFKVREKERERDREREYREYSDPGSRSPGQKERDRRRGEMRERERETRVGTGTNSVNKKDEKERLGRVGDWSEHISSSGKKYYYNCRSEVSQWEKPTEWLSWERTRSKDVPPNAMLRPAPRDRHPPSGRPEKHIAGLSEGYRSNGDSRDTKWGEGSDRRRDGHPLPDDRFGPRREGGSVRKFPQDVGTADMDISSGEDSGTPTSDLRHPTECRLDTNNDTNHHDPTPSQSGHPGRPKLAPLNLPPAGSGPGGGSTPHLLNSHPRLMALSMGGGKMEMGGCYDGTGTVKMEPLNVMTNSHHGGAGGPPTPTHSENHDVKNHLTSSPISALTSLQALAPGMGMGTLGTNLGALRPQVPTLTPSLANYYKETLITHVQNWPGENLEKQAQRLGEEAHTVGSLMTTKVSAELKMARSLVRLAEIQATLHEQRILFLRAQRRELEETKGQSSYMNDC